MVLKADTLKNDSACDFWTNISLKRYLQATKYLPGMG